jgi:hypothetical protein
MAPVTMPKVKRGKPTSMLRFMVSSTTPTELLALADSGELPFVRHRYTEPLIAARAKQA